MNIHADLETKSICFLSSIINSWNSVFCMPDSQSSKINRKQGEDSWAMGVRNFRSRWKYPYSKFYAVFTTNQKLKNPYTVGFANCGPLLQFDNQFTSKPTHYYIQFLSLLDKIATLHFIARAFQLVYSFLTTIWMAVWQLQSSFKIKSATDGQMYSILLFFNFYNRN